MQAPPLLFFVGEFFFFNLSLFFNRMIIALQNSVFCVSFSPHTFQVFRAK